MASLRLPWAIQDQKGCMWTREMQTADKIDEFDNREESKIGHLFRTWACWLCGFCATLERTCSHLTDLFNTRDNIVSKEQVVWYWYSRQKQKSRPGPGNAYV
ncbi:hypothetical protein FOA52_003135 [Chlamydomonas sp. UWO 241]|nr:hypothetical protein FOA52_003135 [Chlamydomonas sp. UWO 241]